MDLSTSDVCSRHSEWTSDTIIYARECESIAKVSRLGLEAAYEKLYKHLEQHTADEKLDQFQKELIRESDEKKIKSQKGDKQQQRKSEWL